MLLTLPGGNLLGRGSLPHLHRTVLTSGGDLLAIPREERPADEDGVPAESEQGAAGVGVPEDGGAVVITRNDLFAARGERDGGNRPARAIESVKRVACGRIPEDRGPLRVAG